MNNKDYHPFFFCVVFFNLKALPGAQEIVRYIYMYVYVYMYFFFAMLSGLWDLNSPTRDQTQALGSESTES